MQAVKHCYGVCIVSVNGNLAAQRNGAQVDNPLECCDNGQGLQEKYVLLLQGGTEFMHEPYVEGWAPEAQANQRGIAKDSNVSVSHIPAAGGWEMDAIRGLNVVCKPSGFP